jgi:hypothetical protein
LRDVLMAGTCQLHLMGLKRMHTPCFAPAASVAETSPVRVRRFALAARKEDMTTRQPGQQPPVPGEILDKPIQARHSLPLNALR